MTGRGGAADVRAVILAVGAGTFLLRFSFLGLVGSRTVPAAARRLLRCTAVAVLPGLVAPVVLWPPATAGAPDAARLIAAAATVALAVLTLRPMLSIAVGAVVLWAALSSGPQRRRPGDGRPRPGAAPAPISSAPTGAPPPPPVPEAWPCCRRGRRLCT
jgi:branched-subunit amino acid transport protein